MIEIKKQNDSSYKFHVQTENGQVLMTSRTLISIDEVEALVELMNAENKKGLLYERKTNHEGEFLFNVKDADGQLIGSSQLYNSEAGMENGINNLKIRLAAL